MDLFLFLKLQIAQLAGVRKRSFRHYVNNASGFGGAHHRAFHLFAVHGLYGQYPTVFHNGFPDFIQKVQGLVTAQGTAKTLIDLAPYFVDLNSNQTEVVGGGILDFTEFVDHRIDGIGNLGMQLQSIDLIKKQRIVFLEFFKKFLVDFHGFANPPDFSETGDFQSAVVNL